MRHKTDKPAKPVAAIAKALRIGWLCWLILVIVIYPAAMSAASGAPLAAGVVVQLMAMIPALLVTPMIWQGKNPILLIWVSLLTLIYLGVASVAFALRAYEGAPVAVSAVLGVEALLLFVINALLFVLLKRLPAAHKS